MGIIDTKLMQVSDVVNAISLAGVLIYFLAPAIITLTIVYIVRRIINKRKFRVSKGNIETSIDSLSGKSLEPEDYTKFKSLSLEFDKDGKVKKER